ncbi:MAG: AMP-binding protein [Polyangiaceae bacterium]
MTDSLDVSSLLAGSRLLVLGGTGFVGKVFWAMLLDRYPDVGQIFLLVRSGNGRSSEGRFWSQIAKSEPLEPLRKTHGAGFEDFLREKIVVLDGDVGEPLCGIDESVVRELSGTIDAVVNVAGVVDFNPPLDEALDANARGTMHVVALTKALGNVPLMHTSTCYTAGRRKGPIVETDPLEIPFPRAGELPREIWDAERELAECAEIVREVQRRADDAFRQSEFEEEAKKHLRARGEPTQGDALDRERTKVRRKFVSEALVDAGVERANHWGWPNIYTYTKSLGEQLIARSGVPYTLVRPACCESTVAFPFVGWNEGISTSAPIIYLIMKGQVQLPLGEVPLDLIPTDYVCAGMILALAELLEGRQKPVYQLAGADVNPCTVARFGELTGLYKRKYYQRKGTGNPIVDFFQAHIEPVAISEQRFDAWSSPAMGKIGREIARAMRKTAPALKPAADAIEGAAKREEKIAGILKLFAPFTAKQNGPFSCANVRAAHARLSDADRAKLPWAPESLDWPTWFHTVHMPAMEKYILPEMDKKLARETKGLEAHETLVSLLEEMAERHAHAPALTRLEKEEASRVTYLELRARSRAVAARLAAAGVKKGDRVVLSAKNHPDWAITYFGILRAGAVAVPLDPALDEEARTNLIADCAATAVISDSGVPHSNAFNIRTITLTDDSLVPPSLDIAGDDVASLLYTSGTTGKPKGVKLTHANFSALIASLAPLFPLSGKDRVLSVLPLHHTFEFTCGLLLPLSRGSHVMYLDELNGHRLAEGLNAGKITAMVGVPALWQLLERRIVSEIESRGALASTLFHVGGELNRMLGAKLGIDAGRVLFGPVHAGLGGELRWLISGGAALPKETHDRFAKMGLPLAEGYGLTEAAPVLTVAKASTKAKAGNVGKPIPGVELKIASPDAEGVGEVIARGPNVMAGYTDDVATARAIDGQGWLHTGDLGKLDKHGRLVLVSRIKDVVVGPTGENVYPDDVEQRIGTVPGVAELAIVGVGSDSGEKVACLAVPEKDDLEEERGTRNDRVRAALRSAFDKLPPGQRPSIMHLSDQALPRTATRKVKRDEVRAILTRKMAATDRAVGGGVTSEVRTAIAAITGVTALATETTLQGDLSFDSLRFAELLEALEARGRTFDPAALQACLTVGEVETLVGQEPSPRATPARARIEKGEQREIVLPPMMQDIGKRFVGKLQDAFYDQVMKTRVVGRAFIPHNRATIVVANHASHLDMGLVRHALGKYGEDIVSLAAQDYFFEGGGGVKKAFFANLTNLVALDRQGGLRAALRQASEVISSGKTVLLFPEGTRSTTGEIGEFKPMMGQLALAHGVDVLPVFLAGTHAAMPKGSTLPTKRDVGARIGPPLRIEDLRRLTAGMSSADAAREVAKLARAAVAALQAGKVLDLSVATAGKPAEEEKHPLVTLFAELEEKFNPEAVDRPVSYYFTLGNDELAKWTVKVDGERCEVRPGKPDGGQADCVLKTSSEIFTKIVRESYVPGPSDFLSGAIKSNDVSLLLTFQKIFQLES